jgi:diacylglycerol O-acyltransferase / wax synthase
MKQLSTVDTMFMAIDTPDFPMHGMGIVFLDPSTAPREVTFERIRELFAERVDYMVPFRRRLVTVPLGLDRPFWIHDEGFDLDHHLHHVAVPSPGSMDKLLALLNRIGNIPLDRDRPLWAAWFIEGLADGRLVLVLKAHHACIDGVGGLAMLGDLVDREPDPAPRPPAPPVELESMPTQAELAVQAVAATITRPVRTIRAVAGIARSLLPGLLPQPRPDSPLDVVSDPAPQAPSPQAAPFNTTTDERTHRNLAMTSLDLAEVKRIGKARDGTVNDVFLSIVGGALRRYVAIDHEPPTAPLRAAVPVNLRTGDEDDQSTNIITVVAALVRVDIDDPVERLDATVAATRKLKSASGERATENMLESAFDLMTPAAAGLLSRAYVSLIADRVQLPFHLLLSNVPGPAEPWYVAGARIDAFHIQMMSFPGLGPIVVALSLGDRLYLSVTGTDEITPDVEAVVSALDEEMAALCAAVPA